MQKKEIIVEEPTAEDHELLDLEGFYNVVVIKNYVYLDDATLFQYTESRHRLISSDSLILLEESIRRRLI